MAAKKRKVEAPHEPLSIRYELAELPSSQHRAGLAGLVLAVRYLQRSTFTGTCNVDDITASGATFVVDATGMAELFDLIYAATRGESHSFAVRRNKNKELVAPLREDAQTYVDPKTGKEKRRTLYIYPLVMPKLSCALDLDPMREHPLWTKLLRDMIWSILRGVPATREAFDARAAGRPTHDAQEALEQLASGERSVELPSTYYLGAMAKSAEDVPFRDRGRNQFLLHFWPLSASVYVPEIETREGTKLATGYAIAIPDVAHLQLFCEELPHALRERSTDTAGFRPRGAVISLPEEAGMAALGMLSSRVARAESQRRTSDLVTGYDIVFADKQGNSIKLLSIARVDCDEPMIDAYLTARTELWDPSFRRVVITNLLHERAWFRTFDRELATVSVDRVVPRVGAEDSKRKRAQTFAHDARVKLRFDKEKAMAEPKTLEDLVKQVVGVYLARKLKGKDLEWEKVKGGPRESEYKDKRSDLARGAFLAVRSRTNAADFREYFVATLCSMGQPMNDESFHTLSRALSDKADDVRTLTMLALSASA